MIRCPEATCCQKPTRPTLVSLLLSGSVLTAYVNRYPYELKICNKCDWHTVQDEEHIILDCPSQDLTILRAHFKHLFSSHLQVVQHVSLARQLHVRDFMIQADDLGLAELLQASVSQPSCSAAGGYSDVRIQGIGGIGSKSRESPPPEGMREASMWVWWVSCNIQPWGTRIIMSVFVFNLLGKLRYRQQKVWTEAGALSPREVNRKAVTYH
eukprot:567717-Pelagomonas_calceolata.AAC.1